MLRHPCILGGPQTKGDKIRIGCLTPAFSGIPKERGTKPEVATKSVTKTVLVSHGRYHSGPLFY